MTKHETTYAVTTASSVLEIDPNDIAGFVQACLRERSLSSIMADLNRALLFGTREEQEQAEQALNRLGFL